MYKLEHEMQQNKRFRDDERNCYTDPEVNKNEQHNSVFPFLDQLYPILKVSFLSKRKNNWIRYCDKQVRKLHVPPLPIVCNC